MKCEKCGKNEATVYYKENINGAVRELHLCPACAKAEHIDIDMSSSFEKAWENMNSFWSDPFHSFLGGGFADMWQNLLGSAPKVAQLGTERKCPTCGMTESQLRKTGRVGCPDCYRTFSDILNRYMQKVHGATQHIGIAPPSGGSATNAGNSRAAAAKPNTAASIAALRSQLQTAVAQEEYEQAARLRDEIRRLEGEQS